MEQVAFFRPSSLLAPYVKHYWILRTDGQSGPQRIIPSGHIQMVFYRGARVWLPSGGLCCQGVICGHKTDFSDLVLSGPLELAAVVFQPCGVRAFFDRPMNEFSGAVVPLDAAGDKGLAELEKRMMDAVRVEDQIALLEEFLSNRLRFPDTHLYNRLQAAVQEINRNSGELRVSQLAAGACLGEKQFRRIFADTIGTTSKDFIRTVRFQRALSILGNEPGMTFTRLAYRCGYYDQAHLTAEFKEFSGYSPRQYLAACQPYSDYFSSLG